MQVRDVTILGAKVQLVELMFSALPSIVLITIGHAIAGLTAWFATSNVIILLATVFGALIGSVRVALCLAFAKRRKGRDSLSTLARWARLYAVAGVIYSLSLAALTAYTIQLAQTDSVLLCLTVSMCYLVGMIIRVAVVPMAARLQLLALLIPLAVVSAAQGGVTHSILALLLVLFIIGGLQLISHMHDTIQSRFDAERQLASLAFTDHLTDLSNRSKFEIEGEAIRARCLNLDVPCLLAAIDLDGFKQVNDELGHDAGDLVLRTTARKMRDIVGAQHLVSRLGGDEFAVVFQEGTTLVQASAVVEHMVGALRQQVGNGPDKLLVSASIGLACSRRRDVTLTTLMRWADEQLYRAKAAGKNRLCLKSDDEFPQLPTAA